MPKTSNLDVFKVQYQMMKLSAAWPQKKSSLWYRFRGMVLYCVTLALGVTMFMEAYHDVSNLAKLSDTLYILITILTSIIKYSILQFLQNYTFLETICLLEDPVLLIYPDNLNIFMSKTATYFQNLTKIFRTSIGMYALCTTIAPFLEKKPLPFPFSYELGQYRYVMFTFQVIGACTCGWNNSYLDTLPACLMGVAIAHLRILSKRITQVSEEFAKTTKTFDGMDCLVTESLKQCVKHHVAIIKYVQCIENVFSFSTFAQFFGSVIIICNTLFRILLVPFGSFQFFTLIFYLLMMFVELFMYCWYGNEIIWQSRRVGDACYLFQWNNHGTAVRKCLFIIMERSKRPLKVTAFKFSILSLTTFISIIQWSYSYLAVMQALYKD